MESDRMRDEFRNWYNQSVVYMENSLPISPSGIEIWQAACRAQAKRDAEICYTRSARVIDYDSKYTDAKREEAEDIATLIEKDAGI